MIIPRYPEFRFRIKKADGTAVIFCEIRRRWVKLSPEEWVRQNTYQWLVTVVGYPKAMISIEKGIRVVDMSKRYDLLVYNHDFKPWMLIECKAQDVQLSEDTLMQVLRYNIALPVPYLFITNGDGSMIFQKTAVGLKELDMMPDWT
jgi:hypothetical protein